MAILSAARMSADHPLMGVGPGCFPFEYYPYKLSVESSHPKFTSAYASMGNFGEVHNDHLQVAAESGAIGYLIFAAALVSLGMVSFRRRDPPDARSELAQAVALPLAVAFAIDAAAHFPLHLTATTIVYFFAAVLCISWSEMAELPIRPITIPFEPPRSIARTMWRGTRVLIACASI